MPDLPIIFADLDDLIRIGIIILFFLGPALGQIFKQNPNAKKKVPAPPQPVPPPGGGLAGPNPGQPGQAPRPVQAGRDALEAEIEDFLKRARIKTPQQKANRPEQPARRPQKPKPPRQAPPRRPVRQGRSVVGDHVRDHIEADPIGEQAKQLGRQLGGADERVEQHLHEVFDHKLGQLQKRATHRPRDKQIREGTDDSTWETTAQRRDRDADRVRERSNRVIEMLRDPMSVHEAIILSEILQPPIGLR